MANFETKDSGRREEYSSGMRRDTQDGKARFDLLWPEGVPYGEQFLTRFAELMARGAEKYGDRNWERANSQVELDRFKASAARHFAQWMAGERDEDHAAAVTFNLLCFETVRWKLALTEAEGGGAGRLEMFRPGDYVINSRGDVLVVVGPGWYDDDTIRLRHASGWETDDSVPEWTKLEVPEGWRVGKLVDGGVRFVEQIFGIDFGAVRGYVFYREDSTTGYELADIHGQTHDGIPEVVAWARVDMIKPF